MAKRVRGRGSAPGPTGGAYDAPPDPLVGWGRGHPSPNPPRSAPSALRFSRFRRSILGASNSRLRRSILAFPFLLIYEMTTGRWLWVRKFSECPTINSNFPEIC